MDKTLVLGGNSGIGQAVVNKLVEEYELNKPGEVLAPERLDVDVASYLDLQSYLSKHGPFRYIVYSAGINVLEWIEDLTATWASIAVNYMGFVNLISIHKSQYPDQQVSVVAVSSDAAEKPMRGSLAYCASKAALDMAIRCAARELAPLWRVNGVAPGMVEGTAMTKYIDEEIPRFRNWSPEKALEYERSQVPTGRRATLDEVSELICWILLGPEQINGEIVRINGGR